ncbi:fructokinase [Tunturiibacter gelidoferens]|jgi:fructokinase|uniref:Fructokinase n=1 Tax=Tunturiibacter gelidiferens TaxID=3069689 RepID=A0A9X0U6J4_9BACT|nr:fructokinase [Edaphobacter lichenicola]MBB5331135.1 fructokinase [Edaphobacter lichenicola]
MTESGMRIGIDLGGTKIEALAIDDRGTELARHRVDTPRDDYEATIKAIIALVHRMEAETGNTGTVGAGIPGTISRVTGRVKNANSTWLNGQPFHTDLTAALGREVRVANDANCLAVSEATDGAAAGVRFVYGVILGTGCGGGVALEGCVHDGPNGVAGEWGHNPLPWPKPEESPGPACYCGKRGCMEMWVSGTGIARDYKNVTGTAKTTREIVADFTAGDRVASETIERFEDRLARGLSNVINILDPDVIVVGGGVSRLDHIYAVLPKLLPQYVFGGEASTPIVQAKYGDSSGVRGAAWLWPNRRG